MTRSLLTLSLVSLTLTLAACGQSPQLASSPASPALAAPALSSSPVLGALELSLDATGQGQVQSQQSVLSAQGVLANGAVTLKRLYGGSFDDDATGVRHLFVTFEVTNNTDAPVQNLTLTAYSQANTSVGGTAFKGITNFGGTALTDAGIGRSIRPEHSVQPTATGLKVKPAEADFQAITSGEAAALETSALASGAIPAGSEVLEYGFVARNAAGGRTIVAKGKGQITIALRLLKKPTVAEVPFRFNATWVVSTEATTRITRGPGESTAEVVTRAAALGGTATNPTQIMLVGGDTTVASCVGCTSTRLGDLTTSTAPTYLVSPLALKLGSDSVWAQPGTERTVKVQVVRREDFSGPVTVQLSNPPAGMTAAPVTVPAGATEAEVLVKADGTVAPNNYQLKLEGVNGTVKAAHTLATTIGAAGVPPQQHILTGLRQHPRLIAREADFTRVKSLLTTNTKISTGYADIKADADALLTVAPKIYFIDGSEGLLTVSRAVVDRAYQLAFTYRMTDDVKYKDRLWAELQAAANFPDWYPTHFLDTAEMTHAFAIAYDWLYSDWTPEQRAILREAIKTKGLMPALNTQYSGTSASAWPQKDDNWNLVCNGGMAMGALAIADEDPALAAEVMRKAAVSMRDSGSMEVFAPDGGFPEGPGYWSYATRYLVTTLSSFESALGTEFGFSATPGLSEAGGFPIFMTGPFSNTFNFGDSGDSRLGALQNHWFARRYNRPMYNWYANVADLGVPSIFWYNPTAPGFNSATLPLDKQYQAINVVTMRSGWSGRNPSFLGFRAGDNKAGHSHLDAGHFVYDALNVRWAGDPGIENYGDVGPDYFDETKNSASDVYRWDYYRTRPEGQNTLVFNPSLAPGQSPTAAASITKFKGEAGQASAVGDLTAPYAADVTSLKRGVMLLNSRKELLVQDEIAAKAPSEVLWFMHNRYIDNITVNGNTAMLTEEVKGTTNVTKHLYMRILSPAGATFSVMDAKPLATSPNPPNQNVNLGWKKLSVKLNGVTNTTLAVWMVPLNDGENPPTTTPTLIPLADW